MILDDATTINGMRVPLRAMRYHPPKPHRLDRKPLPWLAIWAGIAIAAWALAAVRAG